jgi:hypothetical protein
VPYRLNADRAAWKRRTTRERVAALLDALGGACVECGERSAALEFHHREPRLKLFSIAREAANVRWARLVEEAAKCDVVCRGCHLTLHGRDCGEDVDDVILPYKALRR